VKPFEVREAQEADAEALHLFMVDLVAERISTIFRRAAAPSAGEEIESMRRTTIDDRGVVFVATADERIIGLLDFHRERRAQAAHSGTFGMSVARGHRSFGVGTALLTSLVEWARRSGVARIELQVFANNPGAIRLYEHLGFAHEGRRRRAVEVDGERIDVLLMALELAG
jgi:RimJ/RimL family protein N-acetyltransferase